MNRILIYMTIVLIYGCNSSKVNQSSLSNSISKCSDKPEGVLAQTSVKAVLLNSSGTTESGQIRHGQFIGYTFEAQAGQKLNFTTSENLCIWVYAPSNNLVNSDRLSETGKYTIQVTVPSGITTFNLAMKLVSPPSPRSKDIGLSINPQNLPSITSNNIRVTFSVGATGTSIKGSITPSQINRYFLNCGGGQLMSIRIFDSNIDLDIIAPDGTNIGKVNNGFWRGTLPMDGDYILEVSSPSDSSFGFNIEVI